MLPVVIVSPRPACEPNVGVDGEQDDPNDQVNSGHWPSLMSRQCLLCRMMSLFLRQLKFVLVTATQVDQVRDAAPVDLRQELAAATLAGPVSSWVA
jgi:hypothetical protein